MMLFFNDAERRARSRPPSSCAREEASVPTFNDASADVPPVENLTKYTKMGFDLVTFSGGKGIRGPQSAGVLVGRKDLIQAARLNTSPNSDTIARGMKVNKEEMLGMTGGDRAVHEAGSRSGRERMGSPHRHHRRFRQRSAVI